MDRRALERLGHHIASRRVALDYRNRTDLADSLEFTVRTLADIEHGVRKASAGTYAMRQVAPAATIEHAVHERRRGPTTAAGLPVPTALSKALSPMIGLCENVANV